MPLSVYEVTRIATVAARTTSPSLQVAGVTLGGSDRDHVEVLINVLGCHDGPCRIQVDVLRDGAPSELHDEITMKLMQHQASRSS